MKARSALRAARFTSTLTRREETAMATAIMLAEHHGAFSISFDITRARVKALSSTEQT